MRVRITDPAQTDLSEIRLYLEGESPMAAASLGRQLLDACESLAEFPNRHRLGLVPGTREITTVWPYVIVYRVLADEVQILRVWHGAQDRGSFGLNEAAPAYVAAQVSFATLLMSVPEDFETVRAERVGELKALGHVRARIARADPAKARDVLALVPDRAPMEGDELPG
jgi:plasmid stabilization system protein ParE